MLPKPNLISNAHVTDQTAHFGATAFRGLHPFGSINIFKKILTSQVHRKRDMILEQLYLLCLYLAVRICLKVGANPRSRQQPKPLNILENDALVNLEFDQQRIPRLIN